VVDVQNRKDDRQIPIDKVGVKNIRYPIIVLDPINEIQHTVASINMYVNLPHEFKGTHMSRFIEVLSQHRGEIGINNFLAILDKLKAALSAEAAHVELEFPYFVKKQAPVSGEESLMEYRLRYRGEVDGGRRKFLVGVTVPITTLCPCRKEMSDHGAHNQRGEVSILLRFNRFFWIEEVIRIVEDSASAPVYALLKREDEKAVTERAYDNPRFVEDVVREVTRKLIANGNFPWFMVEAENFESIHNHSAYAQVEWGSP
jgi:GTP cyclohydrolase I